MAFSPRAALFIVCIIGAITIMRGAPLYADTIYLKNQTLISTRRAWEDGEEVKYEAAGGIKSLPKSAVLKIRHSDPVIVERVPIRPESRPAGEVAVLAKALPVPLPTEPAKAPTSAEMIERLRERLAGEPDNRSLRRDLISTLNAQAALLNTRGEYQDAIALLQRALTYDPRDLTSLINLAGVQFEVGDYRGAEEVLRRAEAVSDQNQYVYYLLGEVHYAQDQIDRAAREWKQALNWATDPKIYQHLRERLKQATREVDTQNARGQSASRHFILRYDQQVADYSLGQKILDHLEGLYARLAFTLFNAPPETITVILYTRQAYFDITRAPGWSGALYDGKIKVPVKGLTEVSAELSAVLAHELTHAFIALAARRNCPAWLNEGIAQWSEGRRITNEQQRYLADGQRRQALWSLSELEGPFSGLSASEAQVAYLEALSAVDYLVRAGRSDAVLKKILEPLRAGASPDEALRQTIGAGVREFEKAWTEYLTTEY